MSKKFSVTSFKKDPEFVEYQDLIRIVADPTKLYSKEEIRQLLEAVLKKEVK